MGRVLPDEGRGPEYAKLLDAALDRLEALNVVKSSKVDVRQRRVIVNLWCGNTHLGSLKQPCLFPCLFPCLLPCLTDPMSIAGFQAGAAQLEGL